jgi:hypothetical protein
MESRRCGSNVTDGTNGRPVAVILHQAVLGGKRPIEDSVYERKKPVKVHLQFFGFGFLTRCITTQQYFNSEPVECQNCIAACDQEMHTRLLLWMM